MNRTVAGSDELMTDMEHLVVQLLAESYRAYSKTGVTGFDLREFASTIHKAQHQVMAQAAARAYPDLYRLAEGTAGP